MWFIFPLVPAIVSSTYALASVTRITYFAAFAAGTVLWNSIHGHKNGEGALTEREGEHYGVTVDETSDHDISWDLGKLAKAAPPMFTEIINKKYDLTISEGHMLRTMLLPATKVLEEFNEIKAAYIEDPNNEDLLHLLEKSMELLSVTVGPVVLYLQQFPKKRVKVIKKVWVGS